jgi:mannose-6-phosphate isomerase-like protein (cupin superfamily)
MPKMKTAVIPKPGPTSNSRNAKSPNPVSARVASMDGGVVRRLTKGDVIIIPANVPHWFKEIQQPITYFGVKVR